MSGKAFWKTFPMLLATILLISLVSAAVPKSFYSAIFQLNIFSDSIIGGLVGSVSAGNPITSYILGGEFLSQGVSLVAVTAFIVAWVTVGIVQLPAEMTILGKRFAVSRNISSFILSIITAVVTVLIWGLI